MSEREAIDLAAARDRTVAWSANYIEPGKLLGAAVLFRQGQVEMPLFTMGWPEIVRAVRFCEDDIFQMHAMIKPMAAVLCMRLMDVCKLQLMDPVAAYSPAVALSGSVAQNCHRQDRQTILEQQALNA
jgi:hypothetical protein